MKERSYVVFGLFVVHVFFAKALCGQTLAPADAPADLFQIDTDPRAMEAALRGRYESGDLMDGKVPLYIALAILRQEPENQFRQPSRDRLREVVDFSTAALQKDPGLVTARMARAMANARLGFADTALKDFRKVVAAVHGLEGFEEIERLAQYWINRLKPWELHLSLNAAYDTNVPQVAGNIVVSPKLGRREDYPVGGLAQFAFRVIADEHVDFRVGAMALGTWNTHLSEYNDQTYGPFATFHYWLSQEWDAGIDYAYSFSRLGNEDYLSQHVLRPSISLHTGRSDVTTVFYEYRPRRFFDVAIFPSSGPFDRTGDVHAVGIAHSRVVATNCYGDIRADVGYQHENVSTKGTEYDSENEVISTSLKVPIQPTIELELSGNWSWDDYQQGSVLDMHGRRRSDFIQSYGLSLTKYFNQNLALQGFILWTNDDSSTRTIYNETPYSFDRTIVGFNFIETF